MLDQTDVVTHAVRLAVEPLARRANRWMQPQLQHREDSSSVLLFEFGQLLEVPRVDDEGLLADRMRAHPQRRRRT